MVVLMVTVGLLEFPQRYGLSSGSAQAVISTLTLLPHKFQLVVHVQDLILVEITSLAARAILGQ